MSRLTINAVGNLKTLGRVEVPEDIGHVLAILNSEDGGWMNNGQVVTISGGACSCLSFEDEDFSWIQIECMFIEARQPL